MSFAKKNDSIKSTLLHRKFWAIASISVIILIIGMSWNVGRPFCGLHSWGQAHFSWVARSHVKYGLNYTKGFDTFAVGYPSTEKTSRYLDHPPLYTLLDAGVMYMLGVNTWSLRIAGICMGALTLIIFIKIIRGVSNDLLALLSGFFAAIFPIMQYFGVTVWIYPFAFLSIWSYLVIINALRLGPAKSEKYYYMLAISLFLAVQAGWEGFFWAMAIGFHYFGGFILKKKPRDYKLLLILFFAPITSFVLNFIILIGGNEWNYRTLFELLKIRGGGGERGVHQWGPWFGRVWEFAVLNFSLPVLTLSIFYLTLGQVYCLAVKKPFCKYISSLKFPLIFLWILVPIFQLFILKGTLWPHQYWERPLIPFIAVSSSLGILVLFDILKRANKYLAGTVVFIVFTCVVGYCVAGTHYYYSVRWQQPEKMKMFEKLNTMIPENGTLLSFDPFIIDQFPGVKEASYRPEIAWYLDRWIEPAQTIEDISRKAATGKYQYYLMPLPFVDESGEVVTQYDQKTTLYLVQLSKELKKRYKLIEIIRGKPGKTTKEGTFLEVAMPHQLIFDLRVAPNN